MKNIVDAKWLYENLDSLVVVDATNNFMDPEEGRNKYKDYHIPGAFHMDLREDMCGPLAEHGGRDPMPESLSHFKDKLEAYGISNDSLIVVYDEDLVPSSRFWWMCKYIGLDKAKVLNGGINAWKAEGYPLTDKVVPEAEKKGHIDLRINKEIFADIDDIRRLVAEKNEKLIIVDSRSDERYRGILEPIDKLAGHIPGSVNYFYGDVLDPVTGYKDKAFLEKHFAPLRAYDEIFVHCGSGVSGSVNIIAMDEIGIKTRFYVGSWSDYISYDDSIIAVEK